MGFLTNGLEYFARAIVGFYRKQRKKSPEVQIFE